MRPISLSLGWLTATLLAVGSAAAVTHSEHAGHPTPVTSTAAAGPIFDVPELMAQIGIKDPKHIQTAYEVKLVPRVAGVTSVAFRYFAGMQVTSVTDEAGANLLFRSVPVGAASEFAVDLPSPSVVGAAVTLRIQAMQDVSGTAQPLLIPAGENAYVAPADGTFLPLVDQPPVPTRYVLGFNAPSNLKIFASLKLVQRGEKKEGSQHSWLYERTAYRAENTAAPPEPSQWESVVPQTIPPTFVYGAYDHLFDDFKWPTPFAGASPAPSVHLEILDPPKDKLQEALSSLRPITTSGDTGDKELWDASDEPKRLLLRAKNACNIYSYLMGALPLDQLWFVQTPGDQAPLSTLGLVRTSFVCTGPDSLRESLPTVSMNPSADRAVEDWAPHALAHQWIGGLVSFPNPEDKWLEEGLASYAAAFYLEQAVKLEGEGRLPAFLKAEKERLLAGGKESPVEQGPVTRAVALTGSPATAAAGRAILYAKSAWIIHMLRTMMFDPKTNSDEKFTSALRDLLETFAGRAATAEDFKKVMEKHAGVSLDGFWRQWVTGTSIPHYWIHYRTKKEKNGKHMLHISCFVLGLDPSAHQSLPFAAKLPDGKYLSASLPIPHGEKGKTTEQNRKSIDIEVSDVPASVEFNVGDAVLCVFDDLKERTDLEKKEGE